jgi:hypothetical protein
MFRNASSVYCWRPYTATKALPHGSFNWVFNSKEGHWLPFKLLSFASFFPILLAISLEKI